MSNTNQCSCKIYRMLHITSVITKYLHIINIWWIMLFPWVTQCLLPPLYKLLYQENYQHFMLTLLHNKSDKLPQLRKKVPHNNKFMKRKSIKIALSPSLWEKISELLWVGSIIFLRYYVLYRDNESLITLMILGFTASIELILHVL